MTITPVKRVLVVGAGSSGLTAIKEFLRFGFDVTAYEARSQVGGAWIYSPEPPGPCKIVYDKHGRPFPVSSPTSTSSFPDSSLTDRDSATINGATTSNGSNQYTNGNGYHDDPSKKETSPVDITVLEPSPMYKLRTNIPAKLMAYRDFPFSESISGPFPRDDEVLEYLKQYAFDVLPHIRFNTLVERIHKEKASGTTGRWKVKARDVHDPKLVFEDEFDAICDCSGHYTRPYIPFVRDLWKYKRHIFHAKWYRTPDVFAGQNVLVVGNSASGYDVGREIATFFKSHSPTNRVYQSIRHPFEIGIDPSENPPWSTHLETVKGIDHATEDSIVLTDGKKIIVDTIIFATGYLFSFPYYHDSYAPFAEFPLVRKPNIHLDAVEAKDIPKNEQVSEYPEGGLQVHNLDAQYQTFYHPDPSLAILCINKNVIPFPLAQAQAHAVAKRWSGYEFPLEAPVESGKEDPLYHKYGSPKEFNVADALLKAAGEGADGSADEFEIAPDGSFPVTSRWRRELRTISKEWRRRELGY